MNTQANRSADTIQIAGLRTSVFWALTLDLPPETATQGVPRAGDRDHAAPGDLGLVVEEELRRLLATGVWQHVQDTLEHIPPPPAPAARRVGQSHENPEQAKREAEIQLEWDRYNARAYAEYIYFHDFVQHFLFNKQEGPIQTSADGSRILVDGKTRPVPIEPFYLFRRTGLGGAQVEFDGIGSVAFRVERVNLYLLRHGVAIVAAEFSEPRRMDGKPLSLGDAMAINDRLRRAHAPYLDRGFDDAGPDCAPDRYTPTSFTWLSEPPLERAPDAAQRAVRAFSGEPDSDVCELARRLRSMENDAREIPPFSHWAWLINGPAHEGIEQWREKRRNDPAAPAPGDGWIIAPAASRGITWRHVSDDRLPLISCIALPGKAHYEAIGEGDWMRLCFVDGPGSDAYPYARRFLDRNWNTHVYDRFHYQPRVVADDSQDEPSRFLLCGYAFIAVGCGGFFQKHIGEHMRRHYYQLMLLCQIELATLLAFSSRITLAVVEYEDRRCGEAKGVAASAAEERLASALDSIEHDLLQYVHRFRFTGISGQLQAHELYSQLRSHMRLDEIFRDLKDELETANAFLTMRGQKRSAVAERELAGAQERLSVIAALAVPVSLALAFLSLNVFTTPELLSAIGWIDKQTSWPYHLAMVAAVNGVAFLLTAITLRLWDARDGNVNRTTGALVHWLARIGLILLAAAFVLIAVGSARPG